MGKEACPNSPIFGEGILEEFAMISAFIVSVTRSRFLLRCRNHASFGRCTPGHRNGIRRETLNGLGRTIAGVCVGLFVAGAAHAESGVASVYNYDGSKTASGQRANPLA